MLQWLCTCCILLHAIKISLCTLFQHAPHALHISCSVHQLSEKLIHDWKLHAIRLYHDSMKPYVKANEFLGLPNVNGVDRSLGKMAYKQVMAECLWFWFKSVQISKAYLAKIHFFFTMSPIASWRKKVINQWWSWITLKQVGAFKAQRKLRIFNMSYYFGEFHQFQ